MAWVEDVTIDGMNFQVGSIGGIGDHRFSLILSDQEIIDAGERMHEILDWFVGEGQDWCLIREWRSVDFDSQYFSFENRMRVFNSRYATEDDKRYCFERPPRRTQPQRAVEPKPNPGYVYLIKNSEGHYKIGKSVNPSKRIESLGVVLPFPIEAVHIISSNRMSKLEKELHGRFEDKHIAGEWFELTQDDVEYIKSL
jgi:hypothetical protein